MYKYFVFGLLLMWPISAQSEVINYVSPSAQRLGTISGPQVQNIVVDDGTFADMDLAAAKHGDDHAMGTLASSCLNKKDYECAYLWAGIALRGSYWKRVGADQKIKEIKDAAAEHFSKEKIADLDAAIQAYHPE